MCQTGSLGRMNANKNTLCAHSSLVSAVFYLKIGCMADDGDSQRPHRTRNSPPPLQFRRRLWPRVLVDSHGAKVEW
ncbi:hypothetical protein [Pandoravirus japonicus]|uniref:Uncharacterized protein n=1 Tax=Pandoravirus japonicus TaxID=2823154 RepID=A0A811BLW6_9VIRU|nr:hypothetical protein [Pandoravirus japonicus]